MLWMLTFRCGQRLLISTFAAAEPRTSKTTTPTSSAQFVQHQFVQQKMLPLLKADVANAVA